MKMFIACVCVVLLGVRSSVAEQPKVNDPDDGKVSLSLQDVCLDDFVKIMTRCCRINLVYDPRDPKYGEKCSVNVHDKPWKPFFSAVLAQHGLLLVEDASGARTYLIIRVASAEAAARALAAQEAVAVADAALADIGKADIDSARARLAEYRRRNAEVVRVAEQGRAQTADLPARDGR